MIGDMIIRWTARLAVACYVARLFCDARGRRDDGLTRVARWWWTVGCLVFVCHVAAAFHFQHQWSHDAAYESTARRTFETTGWNSGVGLYVNYAFMLLWTVDTLLWWRQINLPNRRLCYWLVQGIFGFLMIQATAVFGPPFWMPVVVGVVIALSIVRLRNGEMSSQQNADT